MGITLHSMRWAAPWVAFYRGCPQSYEAQDQKDFKKYSKFATEIWWNCLNAGVNCLKVDKMYKSGHLKQLRGSFLLLWLWYNLIICGRADDPLWTHLFYCGLASVGTLGYNLLVLTCSLKKALSTGIRLSWQGQLRLALPISRNVSIKLLSVLQFPHCLLSSVNGFSHTRITQPIKILIHLQILKIYGIRWTRRQKGTLLSWMKAKNSVNEMV